MQVAQEKWVIVGTAGHIDHGKTTLVKALTGIDPDRLEEEKRRGITIDLGFANMRLPSAGGGRVNLGFVDVPGHERFVRNMLAGAGGIDLVLLIIAADESIKPQTREHFEICRMLNLQRGITVITKADAVDAETLEVVRMEVEDFLHGSFLDLSRSPIIPVSSTTGAGLDHLKSELARVAFSTPPKDVNALLRLPIDRVFVMKGFGTVVTGTLVSGTVKKEEEVEVQPLGNRLRVRGVEVHGSSTGEAMAGQRTALNLASVSTADLARGMTLVHPHTLRATQVVDVELTLLDDARPLRHQSRLHVHCYTSDATARVDLYSSYSPLPGGSGERSAAREMAPGSTWFAQLRLPQPMLLLPGDRFILRQLSPVVTIGGGVVLDAFPMRKLKIRNFKNEDRVSFLETLARGAPEERLYARIFRRGSAGLPLADAVAETGWKASKFELVAEKLTSHGPEENKPAILRIGDRWLAHNIFIQTAEAILAALGDFHTKNALVAGISKEELREKLGLPPQIFEAVLQTLAGKNKVALQGEQVQAAGRGIVMKDDEALAAKKIEAAFADAGLKVPGLKEVIAQLPVEKERAQKIVTLLLRDKVLVKLADDLVFHRQALDSLRHAVLARKKVSPQIDVAAFKELSGVSRKYAIPLLEYLDRERVTRRLGNLREIL